MAGGVSLRLDSVDLRLLRVFAAVVEARGFSAAQTVLNIGASTISNHISALETRLGVKLCRRGRAGFRLTEDGEAVFAEAQRLFAAVDQFEMRAGALRAHVRSSLSVGLVDSTITDRSAPLHEAIGAFVAAVPDVQLFIDMRPPNELLRALSEGRLQAVIGSFPKTLLGLTYLKLYDEPHRFYCGRAHPLFLVPDAEITPEVLARHRLVSRGYWGSRSARQIRSERAPAVVNTMEAEARLILSGAYLGHLPVHLAAGWVDTGEMRAIRPEQFAFDAPFEIAFAKTPPAAPTRRFISQVLASFGLPPL